MLKKDFWYDLPKELIAQEPADPRDSARLMVLNRKDDSIGHAVFRDLPDYLEPGDLLVVNNSKVLPARLMGVKVPTGAVCEVLLLRQVHGDTWECLARPGKRMQAGTKLTFGDGSLTAVVDETLADGNKHITFTYDTETLYEKLDEFGPHGRTAFYAGTDGPYPRHGRGHCGDHPPRRTGNVPSGQ